jgi:hypothetical protein
MVVVNIVILYKESHHPGHCYLCKTRITFVVAMKNALDLHCTIQFSVLFQGTKKFALEEG